MKFTLALFVVVAIFGCAFGCSDQDFEAYKIKFGKSYPKPEVNARHFKTYCTALKNMAEHNKLFEEGKVSWSMGVNQFTDLTPEEFRHSGAIMQLDN